MLITSAVGILVGGLFQEKLRVHQESRFKNTDEKQTRVYRIEESRIWEGKE